MTYRRFESISHRTASYGREVQSFRSQGREADLSCEWHKESPRRTKQTLSKQRRGLNLSL